MPIIFAVSIILLPGVLANFLSGSDIVWLRDAAQKVAQLFQNQMFYGFAYFLLTVFFTYFYTTVVFEPKNVAENLQKNGGFIPGVRPGKNTEEYLSKVSSRITLAGALFLGIIAVMPVVVQYFTGTKALVIGGTGLLIVVSVILETMKQLEGQIVNREYEQL
jgi:preprotein translocase subunit SecY